MNVPSPLGCLYCYKLKYEQIECKQGPNELATTFIFIMDYMKHETMFNSSTTSKNQTGDSLKNVTIETQKKDRNQQSKSTFYKTKRLYRVSLS
jgi:hypothetical protein